MGEKTLDLVQERTKIAQIDHTQRTPSDFIFVSGADATLGCSDPLQAVGGFARGVQLAM